jgi:predicted SAM-dependent methyltransferase
MIRNRNFLISQNKEFGKYLKVGCGPLPEEGFVNLDYAWVPDIDWYWDITNPFPFDSACFELIYSEHCLVHITLHEGLKVSLYLLL